MGGEYYLKDAEVKWSEPFSGETIGISYGQDEQYMRMNKKSWWRFVKIGRFGESTHEDKAVFITDKNDIALLEKAYQKFKSKYR